MFLLFAISITVLLVIPFKAPVEFGGVDILIFFTINLTTFQIKH